MQALETEYRAAIVVEAGEEEHRNETAPDGEEVERRRLLSRASVIPFIAEATDGRHVDGAEAECRAAVLGDDGGNQMPIDLLLPPDEVETRSQTEYRADAVTPVAAGCAGRWFAIICARTDLHEVGSREAWCFHAVCSRGR